MSTTLLGWQPTGCPLDEKHLTDRPLVVVCQRRGSRGMESLLAPLDTLLSLAEKAMVGSKDDFTFTTFGIRHDSWRSSLALRSCEPGDIIVLAERVSDDGEVTLSVGHLEGLAVHAPWGDIPFDRFQHWLRLAVAKIQTGGNA